MRAGKEYKIQFAGLSIGSHDFEFEIDDSFFETLDYSEVKKGKIHVAIKLLKQSTMLVLEFTLSGTVRLNCDRCGELFDLPVKGENRLIVKLGGSDTSAEDDDIVTVGPTEHEIELSQYIYEYIALSIPIRRIHPDDANGNSGCDPNVIEKLNDFLVDEPEQTNDPRWDQLKNIKLN